MYTVITVSCIEYDDILRSTPQFCSFFSTLAQVMDNNFMIGLFFFYFINSLSRSLLYFEIVWD